MPLWRLKKCAPVRWVSHFRSGISKERMKGQVDDAPAAGRIAHVCKVPPLPIRPRSNRGGSVGAKDLQWEMLLLPLGGWLVTLVEKVLLAVGSKQFAVRVVALFNGDQNRRSKHIAPGNPEKRCTIELTEPDMRLAYGRESSDRPRIKGHSVIPAPCITRAQCCVQCVVHPAPSDHV